MKTLPPGPALAYARHAASLRQCDVGDRSNINKLERGGHTPMLLTYLACIAKVGGRLIVETKTGEQIVVSLEGKE
jgi:hypothetical protein